MSLIIVECVQLSNIKLMFRVVWLSCNYVVIIKARKKVKIFSSVIFVYNRWQICWCSNFYNRKIIDGLQKKCKH